MEGTVKWYNEQKAYGFVKGDDGEDYFVHKSHLPQGVVALDEGDSVSFEPVETDKGLQAHEIQLVELA